MTFGTFVRVDLSTNKVSKMDIDETILKMFIGSTGLGAKIVYDEVPGDLDPYDPSAVLACLTGPLTGTGAPGCCGIGWVAKSPLKIGMGESESQGFFGAELRATGIDGIIIKGKASKPVYLWVHDGSLEIRNATHLWGKDTYVTEDILRKELGDEKIRVACIGPAGENLVRFASIMNDKGHAAGKSGMGAVMGSKLLKAVAVRGTRPIKIFNESAFRRLCKEWRETLLTSEAARIIARYGTAGQIDMFHELGDMPVKNWSTGYFAEWEKLTGQYLQSINKVKHIPCFNCPLAHNHCIEVLEGQFKGFYPMEPEYEACAALGSNLLISDINAVIKANDLCNRFGMDVISTGGTIGFAMECFERGIITGDDTGGIDLEFGNVEAMLTIIEKIARREGFGNILAEGEKRAAEIIGKGAIEYAVHQKGMTPQFHDPRSGVIRALGDAVATGVDDGNVSEWGGPNPEFGVTKPLDRFSTEGKAAFLIKMQARWIFMDSIGACAFACFKVPVRLMAETLSAATGWSIGFEQAMEAGDRITQLRRVFNIKCGAKPEDDTLPPRILNHAHPEGGAKGVKINLKPMLEEYYKLRKWDPKSGLPAREELERVGLSDVAKEIYGEK